MKLDLAEYVPANIHDILVTLLTSQLPISWLKTLEKAIYSGSVELDNKSLNSSNLDANAEDVLTRHLLKLSEIENKICAVGGRVLNFVGVSENFSESRSQIINLIKTLNWTGGFYRKDIGHKVIDEWE